MKILFFVGFFSVIVVTLELVVLVEKIVGEKIEEVFLVIEEKIMELVFVLEEVKFVFELVFIVVE